MKPFIYDMDQADWIAFVEEQGYPAYRAGQIEAWLSRGVSRPDEMTDLPKAMREKLADTFCFEGLVLAEKQPSVLDETTKYVFRLADQNVIESVLMRYHYGYSVCISSQAGCRMGCSFCASTGAGFGRNLTDGEMLAQVSLIAKDCGQRIGHVTIMGIGEPLDNDDAVIRFIRRINRPDGLNIGLRHVSVSTCGLVPKMIKFTKEGLPVTLSVSLHAPNDSIRCQLMPVAKLYRMDEILDACRYHTEQTGRRITFEYALFSGINDRPEHADELAKRLKGMLCHVNLIPANAFSGGLYKPSSRPTVEAFQDRLVRKGINATIRRALGSDIMAACGQLRRRMEECRKPL